MPRYAARVEYRGTGLHGFQRQKSLPTVQGELEKALEIIEQRPVRVAGAGRTDAGVHALGQVVAFDLTAEMEAEKLARSLDSLLPEKISVGAAAEVRHDFDPRREAIYREYRYFILNRKSPSAILGEFTHHLRDPLDTEAMSAACSLVPGSHDFSAFMAASETASTSRTVFDCRLEEAREGVLTVVTKADSFLYRMVRIIASALVMVGSGRMTGGDFEMHLEGGEVPCAPPLPAAGLFLWRVDYEPETLRFDDA